MQRIDQQLKELAVTGLRECWQADVQTALIQVQQTRREFEGDYTLVVFPLLSYSRSTPEDTASQLGEFMVERSPLLKSFNVIKGFLNLVIAPSFWLQMLAGEMQKTRYGLRKAEDNAKRVMIEFSSPNTNKPLHLGHIRNNLLGHSVANILEASGKIVRRVNLVNDRGIHICKSMVAWQKFGEGETPESGGLKGDHLVGKYYVRFDQSYKEEVREAIEQGQDKKTAEENAAVLQEARAMLRKWEAGDPGVIELWKKMNGWVYDGFAATYREMGISFDKTYYESETYKLGKSLVLKGLNDGVLYRKEDGSVWADLSDEGLDQKLLLRSDGTSVYMTQDVGTAHQRFEEWGFDSHVYVVGNEQNYHFQVLALVLKKLGYEWASRLFHLSYGMVELPEGKMKSREGTVVDADDLMEEMSETAKQMSEDLGKLEDYSEEEKQQIYRKIGLGALKYFILKVDAKKNMTFDPKESIDFNGNTGPFIQYTYARIRSLLRKAEGKKALRFDLSLNNKEVALIRMMYTYPEVINEAAENMNPSFLANFLYELAKEFNQFYHDYSILSAESEELIALRLSLAGVCGSVIASGMDLLGIEVPERM